jgi:hypothetical protein
MRLSEGDEFRDLAEQLRAQQLPPPAMRRGLRLQAGLSRRRAAQALRVSEMSVTRWESGEGPGPAHVDRYAAFLRMLREVMDS